jgi:hypothetical protein
MTPREIETAFEDQQLGDKFREDMVLPPGVDAIDALWAGPSGHAAGFTTFARGEFLDLDGLAEKLQRPARPIDAWLVQQLGDPTSAALEAYGEDGSGAELFETLLLQDLNRIIQGELRGEILGWCKGDIQCSRVRADVDTVRAGKIEADSAYAEGITAGHYAAFGEAVAALVVGHDRRGNGRGLALGADQDAFHGPLLR